MSQLESTLERFTTLHLYFFCYLLHIIYTWLIHVGFLLFQMPWRRGPKPGQFFSLRSKQIKISRSSMRQSSSMHIHQQQQKVLNYILETENIKPRFLTWQDESGSRLRGSSALCSSGRHGKSWRGPSNAAWPVGRHTGAPSRSWHRSWPSIPRAGAAAQHNKGRRT